MKIYNNEIIKDMTAKEIEEPEKVINWFTINGYGTITWAKIEGSQYENYYADGTPIV